MNQSIVTVIEKNGLKQRVFDVHDPVSQRECWAKESNFDFDFSIILLKLKSMVFFHLTGLWYEHNCKH